MIESKINLQLEYNNNWISFFSYIYINTRNLLFTYTALLLTCVLYCILLTVFSQLN